MSVHAHGIKFAEKLTDRDLSSLLKKAQVPDRKRPLAPTGIAARVPSSGRMVDKTGGWPDSCAAVPSARRMHANAGSRHGNAIYSRPTTLHSQPNHTRRMSHTISTITIIVPTTPKPNVAPPSGHIGHQGYPCRYDRPGFRLSSDQNQTMTRSSKWDLCALRLVVPGLPAIRK